MSWSDIGEFIKAVAPMFTAVAACTGAWIGWCGLKKWRAETIGKRKAELAEDVIADFYEARKYRFIAHFGVEAVKPYNDLSQIVGEIRNAVHMLTVTHKMHKTPELETNHRKWLTTIFGGADDIPKRLDAIVTAIEETCRPAIQETVRIFSP
jgi:hypothetical protein